MYPQGIRYLLCHVSDSLLLYGSGKGDGKQLRTSRAHPDILLLAPSQGMCSRHRRSLVIRTLSQIKIWSLMKLQIEAASSDLEGLGRVLFNVSTESSWSDKNLLTLVTVV